MPCEPMPCEPAPRKPMPSGLRLARAVGLAPAVLLSACASLGGGATATDSAAPAKAPSAPSTSSAGAAQAANPSSEQLGAHPASGPNAASGMQVQIQAPEALKALLDRNLDLVRLSSLPRDQVDDTEWQRLADAAPAQVRELLQTAGYFSPNIQITREPRSALGLPDLVLLVVNPGPQATVVRVDLQAEGDLERGASAGQRYAQATLAALRQAWALPAGTPFTNTAWSDAKSATLARLRAAGYASATWSGTAADVDPQTNTVRLFLAADSGPLFKLGHLDIEGLAAQDAETVRNMALGVKGEPVTETWLLDFQDRLQKSGLFSNITVSLEADPAQAEEARVLVVVREAALQTYTLGLGVSANTGARASVEHIWRRAFGFAATMRNKLEWGEKRQYWSAELSSQPAQGLYRNFAGAVVERLKTDSDLVLSQRLRAGRAQDSARHERSVYWEGERSVRTTDQARNTVVANSLQLAMVYRDLDSVVLPTRGYSFTGQAGLGFSHGSSSNSGLFARSYGRITGYWPLGQTWYGQARLEAGHVAVRNQATAPDSQLFRAGGDESVRGYAYRSLGPLVNGAVGGGRSVLTGSLEVARPISASLPSVWGAAFIDAGQASDSLRDLQHPVLGYGLGVRWRSPVGPLRLDWAFGEALRKGRVHFSVGIAF